MTSRFDHSNPIANAGIARREVTLIEPVLLSGTILSEARSWREECLRRWADAGDSPRTGEATFASPVDGKTRKVVLHLGGGFRVKGKIFIGVRSQTGDVLGEGYTIFLNRERIQRQELMPVLLHELTHAVDPYFDEDVRRQESEGLLTNPTDLYNLPSEQRAFTAMWTEDLREDLATGRYRNPGASIGLYRQRSPEFDGFYGYGQLGKQFIIDQTMEHFRRIVEHLRKRE